MKNIVIEDLEINEEMDRQAAREIFGGALPTTVRNYRQAYLGMVYEAAGQDLNGNGVFNEILQVVQSYDLQIREVQGTTSYYGVGVMGIPLQP